MQGHDAERSNEPTTGDLEELRMLVADEHARLRDEMTALREEVQRLRAERDGNPVVEAIEMTARSDGNTGVDTEVVQYETPVTDGVSRRRLFGLLGGAAAAGAGFAVAGSAVGADRADAADGDNLIIGQSNSNSNPGNTTVLSGSTTGGAFLLEADNVGTSGGGFKGEASAGTAVFGFTNSGFGVYGSATGTGTGVHGLSESGDAVNGQSSSGNSLSASPPPTPGAHLLLQPASGSGPPPTGAHTLGQFWMDGAGKLWQCVVAGTPGTWVHQSPLVPVNPPARVYDSRVTGGPIATGQTRVVTVANTMGIPAGVSAVLTNLTATGANAGGFLAMVAHGAAAPTTSNLNLIPGQDLANNATSAVASNQVDVHCGGPVTSVNFIVDVFGYYP